MGSGLLIFPGNKETGMNYKDNWYPFRQDSSFLYYYGINLPNLYVIIDLDEGKEILFGNDLSPEDMVWVGASDPLANEAEKCGIKEMQPTSKLKDTIQKAKQKGQTLHYLPPYRSNVTIELGELLGFPVTAIGRNYSIEDFIKEITNATKDKPISRLNSTLLLSQRPQIMV